MNVTEARTNTPNTYSTLWSSNGWDQNIYIMGIFRKAVTHMAIMSRNFLTDMLVYLFSLLELNLGANVLCTIGLFTSKSTNPVNLKTQIYLLLARVSNHTSFVIINSLSDIHSSFKVYTHMKWLLSGKWRSEASQTSGCQDGAGSQLQAKCTEYPVSLGRLYDRNTNYTENWRDCCALTGILKLQQRN